MMKLYSYFTLFIFLPSYYLVLSYNTKQKIYTNVEKKSPSPQKLNNFH